MAAAAIFTGASKASTTGGTFADTLTANSGDSLTIPSYGSGAARMIALFAIDSTSLAEGEIYSTRTEVFSDTNTGFRFQIPSLSLGGAGKPAAYTIFRQNIEVPLFINDTLTIKVTTTASDNVCAGFLSLYDNLPGVGNPQFTDWATVQSLRKANVGINHLPVASGTVGAWGAARALTADDNRFHGNTYYALLGCTVQTPVFAISLISNVWGGQRIGLPVGALDLNSSTWFADESLRLNLPLIPWFNQADAAQINAYVMDAAASTSPKVDWNLVELTGPPALTG